MAPAIQIKICGVTTANDVRACVELGADMIGFNFYPASPRYIEPAMVRRIVDALPARICAVGVFVDADTAEIRELAKTAGVRCVQLHGHAPPESCNELAREFRVIRALSTDTRFEPEHTAAFPHCDVLIDAYHPELRGGTGQTCDWSAARAAMRYTRFLILSGGLDAQNVGRAIAAVTPHAVDVCSGVESEPGEQGHWGKFGGRYVPETLVAPLEELTSEFMRARDDPNFWQELNLLLRDYAGRPTPLFHAQRLTAHAGGAQIYLKREDLLHTGAHKINNAVGQALLARRMGKRRIIAETGAGQHGVATATVCALFGLH